MTDTLITVTEFARLATISRRQLDRLRKRRPAGFPAELNFNFSAAPKHAVPRFRLSEVKEWIDSRETWGREPF